MNKKQKITASVFCYSCDLLLGKFQKQNDEQDITHLLGKNGFFQDVLVEYNKKIIIKCQKCEKAIAIVMEGEITLLPLNVSIQYNAQEVKKEQEPQVMFTTKNGNKYCEKSFHTLQQNVKMYSAYAAIECQKRIKRIQKKIGLFNELKKEFQNFELVQNLLGGKISKEQFQQEKKKQTFKKQPSPTY